MRKKIKLRTWIAISLILVLLPVVALAMYNPDVSKAEWFNDAWAYRQPWSFTHNAVLSDRRVTFTIDTQPLTTDKLQADCDDIRFTDNSGKLLRFQLTSACDLVSTTFDVVIPSVLSSLNAGYIYYGNPGAGSASQDVSSFAALSPSGGAPAFSSEEEGQAPVTYWAMDEGVDNTCLNGTDDVCDSGLSASGGARSGAAWQTENICVTGKCLFFDGTDDVVTIANTVANIQAVSFWVKVMSTSTTQEILDLNATDYFSSVSGTLTVNGFGTDTIYVDAVSAATTLSANKWHHVTITTTTAFSASAIKMGQISTNFGNIFLDEVKLYTYPPTAAQVKANFAAKGISDGVSARFGQVDTAFLNDGLVGYWKLEESVTPSADSSGNGNSGTWNNQTAQASGKFGYGATFDGTADSIEVADQDIFTVGTTNQFTVSSWINISSLASEQDPISKSAASNNEWALRVETDGNICGHLFDTDGGNFLSTCSSSSVATGSWYLATFTANVSRNIVKVYFNGVFANQSTATSATLTGNTTAALRFGERADGGGDTNGKVDDVRIYNRVLSDKEIQALYNWVPGPQAYYNFDEKTGTSTAFDRSGNALNGTLNGSMTESDWVTGKFGSALDFDGSNDEVAVSDNTLLDISDNITLTAWVKLHAFSAGDTGVVRKDGGYRLYITNTGLPKAQAHNCTALTSNTTLSLEQWYHLAWSYDEAVNKIYVNGVLDNTSSESCNIPLSAGSLQIARHDSFTNGIVDDVKVYNYVRTSQQIVEDVNGGHPAGGSPISSQVAYWAFDEQQGSTANNQNFSQASLTGSISGALWKTKENCKVNGCLDFDGTDDVTTVTNATAIDLNNNLTSGFTISAWIYPDGAGEGTGGQVFGKASSTYLRVGNLSGGKLDLVASIALGASDADNASKTASAVITQSAWNHVAVTWTDDADDELTLWVNGYNVGSSTNGNGSPQAESSNLSIGGNTSNNFDGKIDEFQIYSSELTSEQVKTIYNQGSVLNFGTAYDESSTTYGGPGGNPPVGWWNLDEKTGTTANDISGNANTGTITAGTGGFNTGYYGSSYNFDNADTVINAGTGSTLDNLPSAGMTISAWIYPRGQGEGSAGFIVAKNVGTTPSAGWILQMAGTNALTFTVDGSTDLVRTTNNSVLSSNVWNHVTLSWDGVITTAASADIFVNGIEATYATTTNGASRVDDGTSTFFIGNDSTSAATFDGKIDEVKVYNYARNQAQISYDYNRGRPIGWWQMDECSGGTANNLGSGSSADGTINVGDATGSNDVLGSCSTVDTTAMWYNGRTGNFNSSLDFDGTNDYVDTGNSLEVSLPVTISGWVNADSLTNSVPIFHNDHSAATHSGVWLQVLSTGGIVASYGDNTATGSTARRTKSSTRTITTGSWFHIAAAIRGATDMDIYINGTDAGGTYDGTGGALTYSAGTGQIGRLGSGTPAFGNSRIDDVRLYNYSLTAAQVKKLYNNDATSYFGPDTGSP